MYFMYFSKIQFDIRNQTFLLIKIEEGLNIPYVNNYSGFRFDVGNQTFLQTYYYHKKIL